MKQKGKKSEQKDAPIVALLKGARYRGSGTKSSETREKFIYAYKRTCGNVTASSQFAGIDRRTFQRWMNSSTRINRRFQKRIKAIEPNERLLDLAEAVIVQKLEAGNEAVALRVLMTKGRRRGYSDRPEFDPEIAEGETGQRLLEIKGSIERRAHLKNISFKEELQNFLDLKGSYILPEIKEQLVSELEQ